MVDQQLIRRVAATIPTLDLETWNFGVSVAFEGLIAASDAVGDPSFTSYAWGYLRGWAAERRPFRELDCTFPGAAAVRLAIDHDDRGLLRTLTALAEWQRERPLIRGMYRTWSSSPLMQPYGGASLDAHQWALLRLPPAGSFLDCLHFEPPFLTSLGRELSRDDLISSGADQCRAYVKALQRPDGLFDHFVLEGEPGTFGPGWGRGQGWALLGLLDTIAELRSAGWETDDLDASVSRLVHAMVARQQPDGHWPAQLDADHSVEEYSTAAFMAYGFSRAIAAGIVTEADVRPSQQAALEATVAGIDEHGTLRCVSAAVMACTEASHYANVQAGFLVPWGQGPALLALCEG